VVVNEEWQDPVILFGKTRFFVADFLSDRAGIVFQIPPLQVRIEATVKILVDEICANLKTWQDAYLSYAQLS
jgi:hypothetical protein